MENLLPKKLREFVQDPESVTPKNRHVYDHRVRKKAEETIEDLILIAQKCLRYQQEQIFSYPRVISLVDSILYPPNSDEELEEFSTSRVKNIRLWDICVELIELAVERGVKLIQKTDLDLFEPTGDVLKDNLNAILKVDRATNGILRRGKL